VKVQLIDISLLSQCNPSPINQKLENSLNSVIWLCLALLVIIGTFLYGHVSVFSFVTGRSVCSILLTRPFVR
jgi:hypothetical protein